MVLSLSFLLVGSALAAGLKEIALEDFVHSHVYAGKKSIGRGAPDLLDPRDFVTLREAKVSLFEEQYATFCKSLKNYADVQAIRTAWADDVLFEKIVDANCLWFGAIKGMSPAEINQLHVASFWRVLPPSNDSFLHGEMANHSTDAMDITKQQWEACVKQTADKGQRDDNDFFVHSSKFQQFFLEHFDTLPWDDSRWDILGFLFKACLFPNNLHERLKNVLLKSLPIVANVIGPLTESQVRLIRQRMTALAVAYENPLPSELPSFLNAIMPKVTGTDPLSQAFAHHSTSPDRAGYASDLLTLFFPPSDTGSANVKARIQTFYRFSDVIFADTFKSANPSIVAWINDVAKELPIPYLFAPSMVQLLSVDAPIPVHFAWYKKCHVYYVKFRHRVNFYGFLMRRAYPGTYHKLFHYFALKFGDEVDINGIDLPTYPDRTHLATLPLQNSYNDVLDTLFTYHYRLPTTGNVELTDAEALAKAQELFDRATTTLGYGGFHNGSILGTVAFAIAYYSAPDTVKVRILSIVLKTLSAEDTFDKIMLPAPMADKITKIARFSFAAATEAELTALTRAELKLILRAGLFMDIASPHPIKKKVVTELLALPDNTLTVVLEKFTDRADFESCLNPSDALVAGSKYFSLITIGSLSNLPDSATNPSSKGNIDNGNGSSPDGIESPPGGNGGGSPPNESNGSDSNTGKPSTGIPNPPSSTAPKKSKSRPTITEDEGGNGSSIAIAVILLVLIAGGIAVAAFIVQKRNRRSPTN